MAGQVSQGAHCAKHARPSHAPIPTCHGVGMGEERDPAPVPCALIARERVAAPERAHTARSAAAPSSSSSSVRYRVAFWRSLMVGIPSNQLAAPFQREPNAPAPLSWPASPPVAGSQIGSTTRTETRDQYVAVLRRSRRAAPGRPRTHRGLTQGLKVSAPAMSLRPPCHNPSLSSQLENARRTQKKETRQFGCRLVSG